MSKDVLCGADAQISRCSDIRITSKDIFTTDDDRLSVEIVRRVFNRHASIDIGQIQGIFIRGIQGTTLNHDVSRVFPSQDEIACRRFDVAAFHGDILAGQSKPVAARDFYRGILDVDGIGGMNIELFRFYLFLCIAANIDNLSFVFTIGMSERDRSMFRLQLACSRDCRAIPTIERNIVVRCDQIT